MPSVNYFQRHQDAIMVSPHKSDLHPMLKRDPYAMARMHRNTYYKKQALAIITAVGLSAIAIAALALSSLFAPLAFPTILLGVTIFIPETAKRLWINFTNQASYHKSRAAIRNNKIALTQNIYKKSAANLAAEYQSIVGAPPSAELLKKLTTIDSKKPLSVLAPLIQKCMAISEAADAAGNGIRHGLITLKNKKGSISNLDGDKASTGGNALLAEDFKINARIYRTSRREYWKKYFQLAYFIQVLKNPFDRALHNPEKVYSMIRIPFAFRELLEGDQNVIAKSHITGTSFSAYQLYTHDAPDSNPQMITPPELAEILFTKPSA